LCRFDGVELPSDFDGLTYVSMGQFEGNAEVLQTARASLIAWASALPAVTSGVPAVTHLHGYSGIWRNETVFDTWRRMEIKPPDSVVLRGQMVLVMSPSGHDGEGCVYGTLEIQVKDCYAEFAIFDRVVEAIARADGTLFLRSVSHSRQRVRLEGTPPQEDGFSADLRGGREFESVLKPSLTESSVLQGEYVTRMGNNIYSRALDKFYRRATV
jgi:hypothetical protein